MLIDLADDAPREAPVCVIWSGEHRAYWRANAAGYTTRLEDAGVYPLDEAEAHTAHCGPEKRIKLIPLEDGDPQVIDLMQALRKALEEQHPEIRP